MNDRYLWILLSLVMFVPMCVWVSLDPSVGRGMGRPHILLCRASFPTTAVPTAQSLQVNPLHRINFFFRVREHLGLLSRSYIEVQPALLFSVLPALRLSKVPNLYPVWGFAVQNTCFLLTHNDLTYFFAPVNRL